MRLFLTWISLFCLLSLHAQDEEALGWINDHLIEIEDASADSELAIFHGNVPDKFKAAKVFGFGEATHHGKEFFDLKAKFFKYLVENQGVRTFIMEENYPAERGINEWISGGKGTKATIASNITIAPWYNMEVVNLLEWIRNFNLNRPVEDQIRFYGMDMQVVSGINKEIRQYVNEFDIPIEPELLAMVDSCVNKQVNYKHPSKWADIQLPRLEQLEQQIRIYQSERIGMDPEKYRSVLRAISYLKSYTYYIQHPKSTVRDREMFKHAKFIIENCSTNGKAFIWAHNGHINNKGTPPHSSGWINLGSLLKEYYKDEYYSVYFDFAMGRVRGYVSGKNGYGYWRIYELKKPPKNSYAKTLVKASKDIFFLDMNTIIKDEEHDFFNEAKKMMYLGGGGYSPKKRYMLFVKGKLSELCDGLIFVKRISVPTYEMDGV